MSVAVEKWIDEPIIILKPDAQVSLQELIDAWFRSTELAQLMHDTPYRIVDLRSTNAPEMVVSLIRKIVMAMVGAPVDPPLLVMFVGSVSAQFAETEYDAEVWFETLDDALNHIRTLARAPSISP